MLAPKAVLSAVMTDYLKYRAPHQGSTPGSVEHGRRGGHMSYRKLSDDARRAIWEAYAAGTTQVDLAKALNVNQSCIAATVKEEGHLLSVARSVRRRLKKLRAERATAQGGGTE